jgi:RNA polymerase sigma factor (sigma-70 family)
MIRPLNDTMTLAESPPSDTPDVDILREMLLDIGRIPMLKADEEERLARGIKQAKNRFRRSMLQSAPVVLEVAELLRRVHEGSERMDRALDVTLADLKCKSRVKSIAGVNAATMRGLAIQCVDPRGILSERQSRKVQRLADEAKVRTSRIEDYFQSAGTGPTRVYQLTRRRYEVLRNRMVAANLRLAVSVAKKYQHAGVPLLDLIQEGSEGLIRAAEKFKPSLGFKFSTYSVWWIQQRVRAAVAEKSRMIRIGDAAANRIKRLRLEVADAQDTAASSVAFEDLNLPTSTTAARREELRKSFYACRDVISLDVPLASQSEATHADSLASETEDLDRELIRVEHQKAIGQALKNLTDRECQVLRLRFGLEDGHERNLAEVGRILDISRERVRQIEQVSLRKLRSRLTPEQLN